VPIFLDQDIQIVYLLYNVEWSNPFVCVIPQNLFTIYSKFMRSVSSITNDNYFDVVVNFIALDLCVCVCESKAQIQART
jgi:hypothetical protein